MTPDNPNDANKPVIDHDPRPVTPGVPDDRGAAPQSLFAEPAKSPADAKAAAKDAARAREAADAKAAADRKAAKAQPPVRVRGGGSNLLTLFLFAVLGGGLYYVWAFPKPGQEDATAELRQQLQDESNRIAALQTEEQGAAQQVQTLSDRVEKLEKAPPPAPEPAPAPAQTAAAPDLGDLPKRVDDLTAKVDALANRPAAAPDTTQTAPAPADQGAATQAVAELSSKVQSAFASEKQAVDDLNARIAKLEQGAGASESTSDRAIRLARVQGALVALEAGEKLGDVPGAPPAVTRFARTAAPTEASLRESFPAVAAHAREVSRPDVANRSFLERTLARLQQSVTVRQGDSVLVGDPAAGVLADAEEKVQTGDLAGAVTTLHTLTGPAADAVKNWVDQASALLAARSALADMAAHG